MNMTKTRWVWPKPGAEKEQMQSDLLRLKKATDAAPFEKDMDRFNRHKEQTSEYLNTLNTLKAEVTDLENRLESLEAKDRKQALEAKQNQNVRERAPPVDRKDAGNQTGRYRR